MKPQARRVHFLEREDLERAGLSTDKFFTNDAQAHRDQPVNWTIVVVALGALVTTALMVAFAFWVILTAWLLVTP